MKKTITVFLIIHVLLYFNFTFKIDNCFAQPGWFSLNSGTTSNLYSVYFTDANTGYAVGTQGIILKTTNAGVNWFSQTAPSSNILHYVFFTDVNTGYIASGVNGSTTLGDVYKTTNAGSTWNALTLPNTAHLNCVYFINSNTGYLSGYEIILKTTNAGIFWESQPFAGIGTIQLISFVDVNTGFACTYTSKKILKTTDGGTEWIEIFTNYEGFYGIHFIDANTGVAVGGSQVTINKAFIIRSTDGGMNWTNIPFNVSNLYSMWYVQFVGPNTGYISGGGFSGGIGAIFKTTNGGANWIFQTTNVNSLLTQNYFINANTGYVVGLQGKILKTTDGGGTLISINQENNLTPSQFSLLQNYPNPFNPTTKISFDVMRSPTGTFGDDNLVVLKVYDVMGREVQTLVNEKMHPGTYSVDWNANSFPSGVYFYRLTTEKFSAVKKMMLVK